MLTTLAVSVVDAMGHIFWGVAWLLLFDWCASLGRRLRALEPRERTTNDNHEAMPEPIEDDSQPLCDQSMVSVPGPVHTLLSNLARDSRLAFPLHRVSLHIVRELPTLAVDEDRFLHVVTTLLLHVASVSQHVHITVGGSTRAGLLPSTRDDQTPMLRVCFEFTPERAITPPFLFDLCRRICVADGGAWLVREQLYCLAWPVH